MTEKILITRPFEDSSSSKKKFEEIGFEPIIIPLIEICKLHDVKIPNKNYDLLIFTSKNAAKIFVSDVVGKSAVFSVGDGTFNILRIKKYKKIYNSKGNSNDLINLFKKTFHNRKINILHPCAKNISMELENYFSKQGSNYEKLPIYEVKKKYPAMEKFKNYFLSPNKFITIYSSKTAEALVETIKKFKLETFCTNKIVFVLSKKISESLKDLNFKKIYISRLPSEQSLINLIKIIYKGKEIEQ